MRTARLVLATATLSALARPALGEGLVKGPGEAGHDAAVLDKMDGLEKQVHGLLTVPLGWGLEAFIDDPANRALVDQFIASGERDFRAATGKHPYEVIREYGEFGDLGMFG